MSTPTMTASALDRWSSLRATVPALLLGLALLGLVFRQEAAAAVAVWSTSTAYNHCFLVLPIAAWLAYDRRQWLPGAPIRPLPWVALAVLPCVAAWLLAERLGIMEGRQLVAMACVELLFLGVLGWRLAWILAAPLLYLFFLVPFGSFLTPMLQDFTANFIVWGLGLMGIPNISDGNTIEIAEGVFFVAEACAGLRFLIASIAFGVLYAVTFYRSPVRRGLFIAASIVVPVLANGVRALGIVAAGHWVGSAEAAAADHLIYGWIFFSFVTLLLIAAGLPFRQDGPAGLPVQVSPRLAQRTTSSLLMPAILVGVLAAIGPILASGLDRAAAAERVMAPRSIAGCVPLDSGIIEQSWAGPFPAGAAAQAFGCSDGAIQLLVVAFPPRTNPNAILALQRGLSGQEVAEDTDFQHLAESGGWDRVTTIQPTHTAAIALWIDGTPSSGGLRSRVHQARNSLGGLDQPPVLAILHAAIAGPPAMQAAALGRFVRGPDAPGAEVTRQLAAFSATPARTR